jgi:hypothetical protein
VFLLILSEYLNSKKPATTANFRSIIDLEFADNKSSGISYALIAKLLIRARILKYVTPDLFDERFAKTKSISNFDKLVKLNLLNKLDNCYIVTDKAKDLLIDFGLSKFYFPEKIAGEGKKDSLDKAKALYPAFDLPDFYALIYKQFSEGLKTSLIPDGLLIRKQDLKYKLEFIEVENDKGNHLDYIEEKYIKYQKIFLEFYTWWRQISVALNLRYPSKNEFNFSITVLTDNPEKFKTLNKPGLKFIKELI